MAALAGLDGAFLGSPDHPAIGYLVRPVNDPVARLNRKIQDGQIQLKFEGVQGYLRSVLKALNIPAESQMVVFSKTSLQMFMINPSNPRTVFFNDAVAVGWVRHEPFVELAAQDPEQGVIFYTLDQKQVDKPEFQRRDDCLICHESYSTLGVPGMLVRSVFTGPDGRQLRQFGDYVSDHRSPMEERWGGWFVTGKTAAKHMGNVVDPGGTGTGLGLQTLEGKFDADVSLTPHSDIVALMVFDHQMRMINLLTRVGWEIRFALYEERMAQASPDRESRHDLTVRLLRDSVNELVDYLLFVDEAPMGGKIQGFSGFAEKFAALGPRDKQGRSLRQFELDQRLMRYRCSYMIYSDAFDALPPEAREAIYKRMWRILSGEEKGEKYAKLSLSDRRAVVEILRETKKGLPEYFSASVR
jgi:hypothetical protein